MTPEELIANLLAGMSKIEASDLHLKVGYRPYYRIAGHLRMLKEAEPFPDSEFIERMMKTLCRRNDTANTRSEATWTSPPRRHRRRYRINIFAAETKCTRMQRSERDSLI